jgi:hypothetical protein
MRLMNKSINQSINPNLMEKSMVSVLVVANAGGGITIAIGK